LTKLFIVYDSLTGNTEKMAKAIADGAREVPVVNVTVKKSDNVDVKELRDADILVLGSPTRFGDVSTKMKIFLENLISAMNATFEGKYAATFGSYGWSGEAANLLSATMKHFEAQMLGSSLRVKGKPSEDDLRRCREFGKNIAEKKAN